MNIDPEIYIPIGRTKQDSTRTILILLLVVIFLVLATATMTEWEVIQESKIMEVSK